VDLARSVFAGMVADESAGGAPHHRREVGR